MTARSIRSNVEVSLTSPTPDEGWVKVTVSRELFCDDPADAAAEEDRLFLELYASVSKKIRRIIKARS